jgi:DNA-binding NtrC family response regulator
MARIIIIDDDDALRDTLVRILTEAGHTIASTVNGFEG